MIVSVFTDGQNVVCTIGNNQLRGKYCWCVLFRERQLTLMLRELEEVHHEAVLVLQGDAVDPLVIAEVDQGLEVDQDLEVNPSLHDIIPSLRSDSGLGLHDVVIVDQDLNS